MINKFSIKFFLIICFFFQSLLAEELNINANIIEIDKENKKIRAEGNVEVTDTKNNLINSKKIIYDKANQLLNTFGETEIITSEKFQARITIKSGFFSYIAEELKTGICLPGEYKSCFNGLSSIIKSIYLLSIPK